MTASTDGVATPTAPAPADRRRGASLSRRTIGRLTLVAAVVDAVGVVSLILFYAFEVSRPRPHLWGPLSDGSSALFDLLLLPLLWLVFQRLASRPIARGYALVTVVATAVGVFSSGLLVLGLLQDVASFVLTMIVIAVQAGWFVLMGRRGREALGLGRGVARWALLVGLGMLVAIVLFVPAYLLPATSPAAIVLWIVLGLVGGLGWISWAAWFAVVGRTLIRQPESAAC